MVHTSPHTEQHIASCMPRTLLSLNHTSLILMVWDYPLIITPETAVSTPVPDPETRVARANKCPPKNY